MEEKYKYILNEEKRNLLQKSSKYILIPRIHKRLKKSDSAVFFMDNKYLLGLREQPSIKNIEFDSPYEILRSQKYEGRNLPKIKTKLLRLNKSNLPLNQNQTIKSIFVFNKIRSKYILVKNQIIRPFIATIHNSLNDIEKNRFSNSYINSQTKSQQSFDINCMNKNSQTEKPEVIKLEIKKIKKDSNQSMNIKQEDDTLKDRIPINTLKYFHPQLFKHKKNIHKKILENKSGQEESKVNNKKSNENFSESSCTSQNTDNFSVKYEIMEFNNKKNYIAHKLQRRQNNSQFYAFKKKQKSDFHYLMKHPFSDNFFCSTFINHKTFYNNNSYINDYSEQFQNLENPLKDNDLIRKLHNLILNPNTNKIRNGKLLLMYRNFPKGTFYGNKNSANNSLLIDEELKKLENTKYGKFVIKLNETMQKVKEMNKELNEELFINKNKL